jgi:hypothetical protein
MESHREPLQVGEDFVAHTSESAQANLYRREILERGQHSLPDV